MQSFPAIVLHYTCKRSGGAYQRLPAGMYPCSQDVHLSHVTYGTIHVPEVACAQLLKICDRWVTDFSRIILQHLSGRLQLLLLTVWLIQTCCLDDHSTADMQHCVAPEAL